MSSTTHLLSRPECAILISHDGIPEHTGEERERWDAAGAFDGIAATVPDVRFRPVSGHGWWGGIFEAAVIGPAVRRVRRTRPTTGRISLEPLSQWAGGAASPRPPSSIRTCGAFGERALPFPIAGRGVRGHDRRGVFQPASTGLRTSDFGLPGRCRHRPVGHRPRAGRPGRDNRRFVFVRLVGRPPVGLRRPCGGGGEPLHLAGARVFIRDRPLLLPREVVRSGGGALALEGPDRPRGRVEPLRGVRQQSGVLWGSGGVI